MPTKRKKAVKRRVTPPPIPHKQDYATKRGLRVRELRLAADLVLEDAAVKAGMSPGALSEVEHGTRWRTRWFDFLHLAQALGCEPADLFKCGADETQE